MLSLFLSFQVSYDLETYKSGQVKNMLVHLFVNALSWQVLKLCVSQSPVTSAMITEVWRNLGAPTKAMVSAACTSKAPCKTYALREVFGTQIGLFTA